MRNGSENTDLLLQKNEGMLGISDLRIPPSWPSKPSGHVKSIHQATKRLALELDLISPSQVRRFDAGAFALLSGLVCPNAPLERLQVFNDWHSWLFFFDDQVDERSGSWEIDLEAYMNECLSVFKTGRLRQNPTGLEVFTQNIRKRLLKFASQTWMERFLADVSDYLFKGTLESAKNWANQTVPEFDSYYMQRQFDSSVYTCEDFIEIAEENHELPTDIHENQTFWHLRQLCTKVVAFSNDIFSYEKEVLVNNNPNNVLHVLMTQDSLCLDEATTRTVELINADIETFLLKEQQLLTEIGEDKKIHAYLYGLKAWMSGNILWSLESGRYASPNSPFSELRTYQNTSY